MNAKYSKVIRKMVKEGQVPEPHQKLVGRIIKETVNRLPSKDKNLTSVLYLCENLIHNYRMAMLKQGEENDQGN